MGLHANYFGHSNEELIVSSPTFSYSYRANVWVEYTLRQSSSDSLSLRLFDTSNNRSTTLWQSANFQVYGVLRSCIALPDSLAMTEVRIQIAFFCGDVEWFAESQTAMRRLSISRDACPGKTLIPS